MTPNDGRPIRPRDRDAILQSLQAGVVPRRGHQHIQVGRHQEVTALLRDIERIADGGSGIRFVIGPFGSGKSFFLSLVRSIALEKKLVTVHADMSPERRLYSTSGHARSLYQELMRNLSTRGKPDGGGVPSVLEKFVSAAARDARQRGVDVPAVIHAHLESLSELTGGYDFAHVVEAYWNGHETGNDVLKAAAVRWLRAEYSTKTEARAALGVRTIIDDSSFYDHLKLMGRFVQLSGYAGLLVNLDELVNLYKLASGRARSTNYEQILRILNDCLQGSAEGLGFLLGGTPEFLTDARKGLYSYAALQTRLAENTFASDDLVDLSGPVVRLANLEQEDLYVLLMKLRHVHAHGDPQSYLISDDGLRAFMKHCFERIGETYFRTPRATIRQFVQLLAILEQNPHTDWRDHLQHVRLEEERNPDLAPLPEDADDTPEATGEPTGPAPSPQPAADDDDLASFRLS